MATIVGESGAVGVLGQQFAMINLSIFGYIGYVYLLFLLYPAYYFYKHPELSFHKLELLIAWLLGFVSLLLAQSLLFSSGLFGNSVVHLLQGFIGVFGMWVLVLGCLSLSILVATQSNIDTIFRHSRFLLTKAYRAIVPLARRFLTKLWAMILAFFTLLRSLYALGRAFVSKLSVAMTNTAKKGYQACAQKIQCYAQARKEREKERIEHLQAIHTLSLDSLPKNAHNLPQELDEHPQAPLTPQVPQSDLISSVELDSHTPTTPIYAPTHDGVSGITPTTAAHDLPTAPAHNPSSYQSVMATRDNASDLHIELVQDSALDSEALLQKHVQEFKQRYEFKSSPKPPQPPQSSEFIQEVSLSRQQEITQNALNNAYKTAYYGAHITPKAPKARLAASQDSARPSEGGTLHPAPLDIQAIIANSHQANFTKAPKARLATPQDSARPNAPTPLEPRAPQRPAPHSQPQDSQPHNTESTPPQSAQSAPHTAQNPHAAQSAHNPQPPTPKPASVAELISSLDIQEIAPQAPDTTHTAPNHTPTDSQPQDLESNNAQSMPPLQDSPSLDSHAPTDTLTTPTHDAPAASDLHAPNAPHTPSAPTPSLQSHFIESTPQPTPPLDSINALDSVPLDSVPAPSAPLTQSASIDFAPTESTPLDSAPMDSLPLDSVPKKAPIVRELEENTALLKSLDFGKRAAPLNFKLPPTSLLNQPDYHKNEIDEVEIDTKSEILLAKLKTFKIDGDVVRTYTGPIVTTFEFRPAPNVKVSRILNLEDDIALALSAKSIRIQAPVPGKDVVGIEIPNNTIETIFLREVLESELFKNAQSPLALAFGKDIVGNPFIQDLRKLPHLLIAGTTGSGKSVGLNAMILSLLYRNSPDMLRLMMIDPKRVEFALYSDIPHLITPIITDPKKAIVGLNNAMHEMDRRYEKMKDMRVKDIEGYNKKAREEGEEEMQYFVIVIDELADLMQTSGREAEAPLSRIAQMGRACGMHLIIATQRPSVDVVTGTLKGNLPSRISYKVGSKVDSKVILDDVGAASLLGRGDMLFKISDTIMRLHAPFSTEAEIESVVEFLKSQREPQYDKSFLLDDKEQVLAGGESKDEGDEDMLEQIKRFMLESGNTSSSSVQRRFSIGFNRATNYVEQLEKEGFLSKRNAKGVREIIR